MNWRMSNAELSRLFEHAPWLYMIEWRERLDRCVMHLDGGARAGKLMPDEARLEAESLRATADWLAVVADRMESDARRAERVAALRNVEGRTPEEAAMFLAKADEIEAAASNEEHPPAER